MNFSQLLEKSRLLENPFVLEHPGTMNGVQIHDWMWLVVRLIGLVLVAWVVVKFVLPTQITPHLVSRKQDIQVAAEQVDQTMRETRQMRDEYRKRLEGIQGETESRMSEAVREAEDLRNHIVTEARQMAEVIVRRGEEEVSRERAKALVGLRRQFVEDVIGAAEYAASRLDGTNQRRLVQNFVQNVGVES